MGKHSKVERRKRILFGRGEQQQGILRSDDDPPNSITWSNNSRFSKWRSRASKDSNSSRIPDGFFRESEDFKAAPTDRWVGRATYLQSFDLTASRVESWQQRNPQVMANSNSSHLYALVSKVILTGCFNYNHTDKSDVALFRQLKDYFPNAGRLQNLERTIHDGSGLPKKFTADSREPKVQLGGLVYELVRFSGKEQRRKILYKVVFQPPGFIHPYYLVEKMARGQGAHVRQPQLCLHTLWPGIPLEQVDKSAINALVDELTNPYLDARTKKKTGRAEQGKRFVTVKISKSGDKQIQQKDAQRALEEEGLRFALTTRIKDLKKLLDQFWTLQERSKAQMETVLALVLSHPENRRNVLQYVIGNVNSSVLGITQETLIHTLFDFILNHLELLDLTKEDFVAELGELMPILAERTTAPTKKDQESENERRSRQLRRSGISSIVLAYSSRLQWEVNLNRKHVAEVKGDDRSLSTNAPGKADSRASSEHEFDPNQPQLPRITSPLDLLGLDPLAPEPDNSAEDDTVRINTGGKNCNQPEQHAHVSKSKKTGDPFGNLSRKYQDPHVDDWYSSTNEFNDSFAKAARDADQRQREQQQQDSSSDKKNAEPTTQEKVNQLLAAPRVTNKKPSKRRRSRKGDRQGVQSTSYQLVDEKKLEALELPRTSDPRQPLIADPVFDIFVDPVELAFVILRNYRDRSKQLELESAISSQQIKRHPVYELMRQHMTKELIQIRNNIQLSRQFVDSNGNISYDSLKADFIFCVADFPTLPKQGVHRPQEIAINILSTDTIDQVVARGVQAWVARNKPERGILSVSMPNRKKTQRAKQAQFDYNKDEIRQWLKKEIGECFLLINRYRQLKAQARVRCVKGLAKALATGGCWRELLEQFALSTERSAELKWLVCFLVHFQKELMQQDPSMTYDAIAGEIDRVLNLHHTVRVSDADTSYMGGSRSDASDDDQYKIVIPAGSRQFLMQMQRNLLDQQRYELQLLVEMQQEPLDEARPKQTQAEQEENDKDVAASAAVPHAPMDDEVDLLEFTGLFSNGIFAPSGSSSGRNQAAAATASSRHVSDAQNASVQQAEATNADEDDPLAYSW